jgi:hypothetical protein
MAMKLGSRFTLLVAMLASVATAHCSEPGYEEQTDYVAARAANAPDPDDVAADLASSSYENEGAPYGCTQDCSGHEAGWAWAADNGVTDSSECGGRSQSFSEGCIAFAEALVSRTTEY